MNSTSYPTKGRPYELSLFPYHRKIYCPLTLTNQQKGKFNLLRSSSLCRKAGGLQVNRRLAIIGTICLVAVVACAATLSILLTGKYYLACSVGFGSILA